MRVSISGRWSRCSSESCWVGLRGNQSSRVFRTTNASRRIVGQKGYQTSWLYDYVPFLLYLVLLSLGARAQFSPPNSKSLTTINGLPHNTVTGVEQDRAGFLWIATHDGLARYDGRAVKVFRNQPGDSSSLADNKIVQFEPAMANLFLVVSGLGTFQLFDPATERFSTLLTTNDLASYKLSASGGHLSADGNHLWGWQIGSWLFDYDITRHQLRRYNTQTMVPGTEELHDFVLTPTGYLYSRCTDGLFEMNTQTGHWRLIPFSFRRLIPKPWTRDFLPLNGDLTEQAPDGRIAVFAYQHIVLYDPAKGQFRTIPIPDAYQPNPADKPITPGQTQKSIFFALQTLADNHLYLGYANSLFRLEANDQFRLVAQSNQSLPGIAPWLYDRSGVLWISGQTMGVAGLDQHPLPFGFAPTRKSFSQDLLEQDLGVALPPDFEVWQLGALWPRYTIGPNQLGYLIDPSHVYQHRLAERRLVDLTDLRVNQGQACCKLCLKISPQLGSRAASLWLYNNYRGLIQAAPDGSAGKLWPRSQLPLTHPGPYYDANDIQPMGRWVWVGSRYGLGLFRYDTLRKQYDKPFVVKARSANSLPVNSINCLTIDPVDPAVLWIGTAGGGLCRLATRTMSFRRLGEADGFPDGTIHSFELDGQGMLWCATNRGLVRVNPKDFTFRHFTSHDGLADQAFLHSLSARLPDGRLVFGTATGRVIFDPAAIRDRGYEPPVVLTSLQINNKPAEANPPGRPAGQARLSAPLNALSELVLDHTQNFLTITFAGLDFAKTEKITYRYQLTGVDATWVEVGTQNTANYTQLSPGRYLFRVNSSTADGRWSRRAKELVIVITPPFWATWWAYGLYALVAGGLVLSFIRFRLRQARQQQEMTAKRREAEQLRAISEMQSRFFANITHEFRTPLTLILAPTEQLLGESSPDSPARQRLSSIHCHANQLLRLINQLLELTKLESGRMRVSLVRGNPVTYIQQLAETFRSLARSRGIALHVFVEVSTQPGAPEPGAEYGFDADKWETILTNLLTNALKFTPAGGQVSLTIERPTTTQLVVGVADTGIGIDQQHLPRIFERFYQADDSRTRPYEGTGIGLALVNELTQLLGGVVSVESRTEPPTGTVFTLTLPILPALSLLAAPELKRPDLPLTDPFVANAPVAVPLASPQTPRVLIVEDNEELRSFIADQLRDQYRVLTAGDGQDGWIQCRRELPELVIADVMMPRLDGYQLTQYIKSSPVTNHIAVLLLTARTARESRLAGLAQGADEYLTKPFDVGEFKLRVANLLARQAHLRAHLYGQLMASAERVERPVDDPFIRQLQQVIEVNLDNADFGVDALAVAVAMSRRTLHRKLTAVSGIPPADFIRQYRLGRALELLRSGHSVADTAYRVGFESSAYFATVFKQVYQQTPSEFLTRSRA